MHLPARFPETWDLLCRKALVYGLLVCWVFTQEVCSHPTTQETPASEGGSPSFLLFDAGADFLKDEITPGSENGRNGVWTYGGYNPSLKVFTPFTSAQHVDNWPLGLPNTPPQGTFQGYASLIGDQTPSLLVNTDTVNAHVPCCDMTAISAGKMLMHPSSPGGNNFGDTYDVPTVRWSAPVAGTAKAAVRWIQRHGNAQRGYLLTNGATLFTGVLTTGDGLNYSSGSLQVAAGQTIEVGIGPGPSGYTAGTSELDFRIEFTVAAPQPIGFLQQPASITVSELLPATFMVAVNNFDPVGYQWKRNEQSIPGANAPSYTLPSAGVADNGASFRCVVTNLVSTNVSASAILTVIPDTLPPSVMSVRNTGRDLIDVSFTEPVDDGAVVGANYELDGAIVIEGATLSQDRQRVTLRTTPLTMGVSYSLRISNIRDRSAAGNRMQSPTLISFVVSDLQPAEIGAASQTAVVTSTVNGYVIQGAGRDVGGLSDQCHLSFQTRTGDFDVRVRVEGLESPDLWAKAGLMARESLSANSRYAAALATPGLAGCFFSVRSLSGGEAVNAGSSPANFPSTWLRLRREGALFTGFASVDGEHWTTLGSSSLSLPPTLYFGLALASHDARVTAKATFRGLDEVIGNPGEGAGVLGIERLSACSRRTGLVISEIMYHPSPRKDGRNLEFVEIFNSNPFPEALDGYRLDGDVHFSFPSNSVLAGGTFLVVAAAPEDLRFVYGISNSVGTYDGTLKNAGVVRLRNERDAVLLEVNYDNEPPWPIEADGFGHSLVLARPSRGENSPGAWGRSDRMGGSPGRVDTMEVEPLRSVVINEFLANPDAPQKDFIELYNASAQTVDLSGAWLSDDPAAPKYRFPAHTTLGPRGFLVRDESALGFSLRAAGDEIVLVNSNQTRVIDAIRFGGQAVGVSRGRFPDGGQMWNELSAPTPGSINAAPLKRPIVINEILFHSITDLEDDTFVELHNRGNSPVDLSGWRFSRGISFSFPSNAWIAPTGYVVIAANRARLLSQYATLASSNTFGNFQGALKDNGERLALEMPWLEFKTNSHGVISTNAFYVIVQELDYRGGGRWGKWTDGGGSSLELVDPRSDNRLAPGWMSSDETAKSPTWTEVSATGVLDLGNINYPADALQILMLGEGECLVDNVEVLVGGKNLVSNGTFESGVAGWLFEGNHDGTSWETQAGFNSARSLHVRASGDGDCSANRIRVPLTTRINAGTTATLRARVRWLRGHPEILLRLRGNWLEAAGVLDVPKNLGTPGAVNSRYSSNAGPSIVEVVHTPVLPAAGQKVTVTARVMDLDGVNSVRLRYRLDPSSSVTEIPMADDGTRGDLTAGDGVYTATLPVFPSGSLVAFYIDASDGFAAPATSQFPSDAPSRECLVRYGESVPFGSFGTYRLWMTQATANRWSSRGPASNQPLDCTFVNGTERVIYNVGAYYSGSPFKTRSYSGPTGNPCDYNVRFPADDTLLGSKVFEIAYPGNLNSFDDPSAQREQFSYWIARKIGLPFNYRRYVNMFVNGVRRGVISEDTQVPNRDSAQEWFPLDSEGEMFKAAIWYDVDNVLTDDFNASRVDATMARFNTTGGAKKTARYRWNFQPHAVRGMANNYTNWFKLVDALNAPAASYFDGVEALVDTDEWMRAFAFEHMIGNWDTFGYVTGGNMFAYKGKSGRWVLFPWDLDISFVANPPGSDLFQCDDPVLQRMNSHPPFRRAYWRALKDLANGPMNAAQVNAFLDTRYAELRANGLGVSSPDDIKSFITQQRSFILGQLSAVSPKMSLKFPAIYSTNRSSLILRGVAPVDVSQITQNGTAIPVTWSGVNEWTASLSLNCGVNALQFGGMDAQSNVVTNLSTTITVNCPQLPRLTDVKRSPDGTVSFLCLVEVGYGLRVEYSDDLSSGVWQRLKPDSLTLSATVPVTDPQANALRFYKASLVVP